MQNKPTDELNNLLENMKPDQIDSYLKDNRPYMAGDKKSFYYYMKDVLEKKIYGLKMFIHLQVSVKSMEARYLRWKNTQRIET